MVFIQSEHNNLIMYLQHYVDEVTKELILAKKALGLSEKKGISKEVSTSVIAFLIQCNLCTCCEYNTSVFFFFFFFLVNVYRWEYKVHQKRKMEVK